MDFPAGQEAIEITHMPMVFIMVVGMPQGKRVAGVSHDDLGRRDRLHHYFPRLRVQSLIQVSIGTALICLDGLRRRSRVVGLSYASRKGSNYQLSYRSI